MESGERLECSSPAPSSLNMASSSTSSSPAPPHTLPSKYSPAPSPKSSSPLTTCGNLLQTTAEEPVTISGTSNGFTLTSHPAFGLYTSSSGRPEFGGLGSLGLSAMAARSQFATFPDWWRTSEAHTRGATSFFPPLLGLHPVFMSNLKRNNPADLHTSDVNGTVNGRSAPSSAVMSTSLSPAKTNKEKTQGNISRSHEPSQLHQKAHQRTKEKKPHKRQLEMSSVSGNQSGSLSDSSTDGDDSSSDDMEEEDEDNDDEDDDDQSSDSEDSDSERESPVKEKRLTQNASESKKKRPRAADRNTAPDRHCDSLPLTSTYHVQTCSHPAGLPQSTSFLPSPRSSEEENQQHISVIQAIGLAAGNSHLAQSHKDAGPLPPRSSPNHIAFSNSSKQYTTVTSPRHFACLPSPKHSSFSSSPKPLALCSPKKPLPSSSSAKPSNLCPFKPLSLSSSPKPPSLLAPKKPAHKPSLLLTSGMLALPADIDSLKESKRIFPEETFKLKQPHHPRVFVKQTFPPKSQICGETNLFLNSQPNGESIQDAPLALIAKPRRNSGTSKGNPLLAASSPTYPMPMNLSTGSKAVSGTSASSHKSPASSGLARSRKTTKTGQPVKPPAKANAACTPVDLTRGSESDLLSSKDSDDSLGDDNDDDDDEDEDEDSGSSLSELESNLESDSNDSEDDIKECVEMGADGDADRTPTQGAEGLSSTPKSSASNLSANCSLLNLQITKAPTLPRSLLIPTTSNATLSKHTSAPAYTFTTMPGSGKRRRVTDERVLRLPLEFGWQRETRIRTLAGRLQGEVAYFAPCGKKLRQYPDVMKYLVRNGITEISRDNFSFSTKIKVGDFYEAREGPEGSRWFLLAEDEIVPIIIAMDGRRSRRSKFEVQMMMSDGSGAREWKSPPINVGEKNFPDISDAKLLRKLEAQEIARQAAQIKMMRKLEKQAMAQAAKEARKQRALMAAEERRKKREQIKILKQQEKIKRIQQIRMEKELRAQQILEAKRKKKEAAANAKILEAEKRNKEKEIRRLQAVILKHQELERHRLDMERERHRQHLILMKAMEARKKAEEKERLKKEKKDEKRLNKERKLELRRLELEKAKELKKPNEDMCLADHKALPELSRIPGLVLPGNTFSDCLMVLQFLHSFGKVLSLGFDQSNMLTMSDLQEGLLNIGSSMDLVQDLLVNMLSAALCDPGMPAGHKSKTILGDHLTNVEINRDNVSEILQLFMDGHSEQTEVAALAVSLRTKAFQAHSPSQKASMLAFLVNELCCSKAVISEIDKNIDCMTNLKKDKWAVEGKLRKLRSIHFKKTGKKDSNMGAEDNHSFVVPTIRNKCKRKEGDSEEEDDEDDDSDDQGDDDDEEEEEPGGRKMKKVDLCDEEDDSVQSASIEELEKQIEKVHKQQSYIQQKMFDSTHTLRSVMIGQDRYQRRYWVLPHCNNILVEGIESDAEEVEKEWKRQNAAEELKVKEEPLDEPEEPGVSTTVRSLNGEDAVPDSQKDRDNLFLQKPGSLSKLSKLLEVARMAQDSAINPQRVRPAEVPPRAPYPLYPTSQAFPAQQGAVDKTDASLPSPLGDTQLKSGQWANRSPPSVLHYDQLSKILTEKNNQWFSLLPRSPCDESSVTSGSSPPDSSSSPQPIRTDSPSVLSSHPASGSDCRAPAGINNMLSSFHQYLKSGVHPIGNTFTSIMTPSLPLFGLSQSPPPDRAPQHAEGETNKATSTTINKSETPEPPTDTHTCASFPAVEVVNPQDFPSPQPIPEEMLRGWWMVSDMDNLHGLVKTLHSRGIRERVLQKQIQKHMEEMNELCADSKDGNALTGLETQQLHQEMVESWCVEEQAMEVDITLLQQVEALERKVISAGLQVKGWQCAEPQSDCEDLVYHEHKPFSSPPRHIKSQRESGQEDLLSGPVVRRPNNPLDIAVIRLAELERNIDRSSEEEVAPGMRLWWKALGQVRSSAQLSLCIQQLQKSIAWERAIMKVHCQLCQKGDNEDLLLLCDGCDKGCHTYCHKPKIITVPEGDWFCPTCVAKESGQSPRSKKQQSRTAGGGKRSSDVKRNGKPSVVGELINEEDASSMPKKGSKEFKKRKRDDSPPVSQAKCDVPVLCARRGKIHKEDKNDLATCRVLLAELESHQDAWPFLTPVDLKAVPGYRKVIKKPMDFSTIREKLSNSQYLSLETFILDVNLVFDNCERFNEDNSEIGRAGHNMRRYFDKRWTELLQ